MKIIGIIPARGGSKSIPLKNIKLLNGKPLIEYSIESALASNILDRIIVSTDHDDIDAIVQKYKNVEVFRRPTELSTDKSSTEEALLNVCDELYARDSYIADVVLTLEPTSPLRSISTIIRCAEIIQKQGVDSVVGVVETNSVYGKIVDNKYKLLFPKQPRRRQDREALFKISSTIFATKMSTLRSTKNVLGGELYPLIINKEEAIDINDKYDFMFAEIICKMLREVL